MDLNKLPLTRLAHHFITLHFAQQDCSLLHAVDATCGNGFDTVFLAALGFENILAFDVQLQALMATKTHLAKMADTINPESVTLIHDGHEHIVCHITQAIDCAIFNLGYLPKDGSTISTCAETTLIALDATLAVLSQHGLITLLCYPGHGAGANETKAVRQWLSNLDERWQIETHLSQLPNPNTPVLYCIKRNYSNGVKSTKTTSLEENDNPRFLS